MGKRTENSRAEDSGEPSESDPFGNPNANDSSDLDAPKKKRLRFDGVPEVIEENSEDERCRRYLENGIENLIDLILFIVNITFG